MGVFSKSFLSKSSGTLALFFTLILLSSFFLTNIQTVHAGLGFSPGLTFVENMQPNTTVQREIVFSRDDTSAPLTLDVTFTGSAAEYLSGSNQIYFAAGDDRVAYPLTIAVPELPTGSYDAVVNAVTHEDVEVGEGGTALVSASSKIILAAFANVRFSVTNEAKQEYTVKEITLQPSEEEQPLGFYFQLINTGNVSARPSKIEIAIANQDDPSFSYQETISGDTLRLVKAFGTENVGVFTKAELKAGKYWMDFKIYDESSVIFEQNKFALQIFPPGTLAQRGELVSFSVDKESYDQNGLGQFTAEFSNTGDIGVSAALIVDLMKGDERLDTLKTEPVFVPPNQTAQFSIDKRFAENGKYAASGYVAYGIFKTQPIEVNFSVGALPVLYIVIGLVLLTLTIGAVIMIVKKHRTKKSTMTDTTRNTPPTTSTSN